LKLCILAAGKGSRNSFSKILPKGFLPIDNKPGLTYLIDAFPNVSEVTIAIGSRGDIYRQFLPMLYPKLKFNFVEIENYDGPGSGPGASLIECEKYLEDEFVLIPTDAFVDESITDDWSTNWMGVSKVDSTRLYCLLDTNENNEIFEIYDKNPDAPISTLENGFNGIAFIKDYKIFFKSLKENRNTISGELQVSNGFMGLLSKNDGPGLQIKRIDSWHDYGSNENYIKLIQKFVNQNLIKNDEFTYIHNDTVYKYNVDENVIKNKIYRAKKLSKFIPNLEKTTANFYSYGYVEGNLLNEEKSKAVFLNFLNNIKYNFFKEINFNNNERDEFIQSCHIFYNDKTLKRLDEFWNKTEIIDQNIQINGLSCKSVSSLLKKIDWEYLSNGIPYNFHGDLQPENIIHNNGIFTFIDWRDSFGTSNKYGDIYYDLAKLDHALLLSGKTVRAKKFDIFESQNEILLNFDVDFNLVEFRKKFHDFIQESNYDLFKVELLTSLIYLNIAPLYDGEYSRFLYYLGQLKLNQILN